MVDVLVCFVEGKPPEHWQPLLERADQSLNEDLRLELAALAQRSSALSLERLARVRLLASRNPLWLHREF